MLRPATSADRPALIALVQKEDAAWSGAAPVSDEEAGEMFDSFADAVVFAPGDRVSGFAAEGILLIDPADDPAPALEALIAARGVREVDAYARDARRIAWLEAHAFAYARATFDLVRGNDPLPAAVWPDDVTVTRYAPEDGETVHALVYVDAAWTEVPGHREKPLDQWRPSPEHSGWVARRDERAVGFVLVRAFGDGRGWIEQIAVARSARGQGLGRALLAHALEDLRSLGATSFALGVQGANESAVRLYREAGFTVEREWRVYASVGSGQAAS